MNYFISFFLFFDEPTLTTLQYEMHYSFVEAARKHVWGREALNETCTSTISETNEYPNTTDEEVQ